MLKANPRDATGLLLRGRLELADGDARAAVADLRSAAKDKPGSTEIASLLARAHRMAGDPQLAREALADVVKFNPGDARAHLLLAADMAQTEDYSAALPEIDAALKIDPRNAGAYEMKVDMALVTHDTAAARAAARTARAQLPTSPIGPLLEGRVLARERKVALALEKYDEAAKLAPSDPQPPVSAISLLAADHQFPAAQGRVDALEKANPGSALALQMRGELALAMSDLPLAQKSFTELAALPGAPVSAYKNLAVILQARNNPDGAFAVLDQGEKAWPADVTLATARAEWLGRAGRIDEAITVYEGILRRSPANELAANNLAYVLTEAKRDKASLDRALQLVNGFGSSSQAVYVDTLGLVQYRLGRYDQAALQLKRAATMAPGNADVQLHYGMALYRSGDVQQGTAILRKVLGSAPNLADRDEAQALIARG